MTFFRGLIFGWAYIRRGLYSVGLIFGGGYFLREISVSKSAGLIIGGKFVSQFFNVQMIILGR